MNAIRYTKAGLVIPAAWVKSWGKQARVNRSADIVILESPARHALRTRLSKALRALRSKQVDSPPPSPAEISRTVAAVRRAHARRR